jgi:OHCU decarboxylase
MTVVPSQMDRDAFVARFGGVYEHSPWIAEQVFDTGIMPLADNALGLSQAMVDIVEQSGREPQLALLCAHPDLAGRLAVSGELTNASSVEQSAAGLDRCTTEQYGAFTDLNERYTRKFGFPFILAVRGYHRDEILECFQRRVDNDVDAEFDEALGQVHRIARLRMETLFTETDLSRT